MLRALFLLALTLPLHAEDLTRFVYEKAEMGLPFRITLYAPDEATAKTASDAAFERVAVLNSILSDYDPDSEISRLSRTAGQGRAVPVSGDLWRVLERGQQISARTEGAFDVTIGPLVNLWRNARRKKELPSAEMIAEMKSRVGYQNLTLNAENRTAELTRSDMRLDVGSIGKAYAVDAALAVLQQRGLPRALVGGSGDMAAGDPPPGEAGWKIEVAPLDAPDAPPPQIILLAHRGIATSGDIFQRVEIDGKRYSHIVDPHTGLGLTDHALVTVLAPDCFSANSLSTAACLLGPERALPFIEATPDAAAHLVRRPADKIEFRTTSRWPK